MTGELCSNDGLFITFGNLKVRIIEAIDILDGILEKPKQNTTTTAPVLSPNQFLVFTATGILDDGELKESYDSGCRPVNSSGCSTFADEYLFAVSSSFLLSISLYVVRKSGTAVLQNSLPIFSGYVNVPISRLGDGILVRLAIINF